MTEWRSLSVYYTDLDKLTTDCVHPLLLKEGYNLDNCFWERHYAGGPQLRVRLQSSRDVVEHVSAGLKQEIEEYIAANPSVPISNYSSEIARKLLEKEDEDNDEDLTYRVNQVIVRPYERLNHRLASDDAAALLEDFLHDSMPVAIAILKSDRPKLQEALRLYFLDCMLSSHTLPNGAVALKSHWEGLSSPVRLKSLVDRIQAKYSEERETIRSLMLDVQKAYTTHTLDNDPILGKWNELFQKYRVRTCTLLEQGKQITFQPANLDEARKAKEIFDSHDNRIQEREFLKVFWEDERFVASIQYEIDMLWPRVLINLLYSFVATVGVRLIDKMCLCYYGHCIVEEHFNIDLTDILRKTIKEKIEKNKHRFQPAS
jgi:Lantibiotic biosynthesis dehydratase C-term